MRGLKGPSHKERQEMQKMGKKAMQAAAMRKEQSGSWLKKGGAIVALFMMCGAGFFQFVSAVYGFVRGNGIENVDIKDTAAVKSVLFGGDPWLVYCVSNETLYQRLPKVLEEGAFTLWSSHSMRTGILDCFTPTESGRSVAERFDFNRKPPLSFVVANGNKPRILNLAGISTPEDLEKRVKPALATPGVTKIDTLKKWPASCTSRKTCIVIGHKNQAQRTFAQDLFPKALLEKYRAARIVTLDTAFWQLKLGDAVMKTRVSTDKKGKTATVVCLSRDEGKKENSNATHSGMFLQDLEESAVDAFVQACQNREGVVQLEIPPKINARPSKPKKVKAAAPPRPRPTPPPVKPKKAKVDSVGSRASLEQEEALFEAVEDEEEQAGDDESDGEEESDDSEDEDSEEVEL